MSRNVIAAAVAGVIVGAFATAVLMSSWGRSLTTPAAVTMAPGINADDVVAVLDAALPDSRPARQAEIVPAPSEPRPVDPSIPTISADPRDALDDLRSRKLTIPVSGIGPGQLQQTYDDPRSGSRTHHAIDILAPRNTPVVAVEDGTVARLFMSKAGGITLYQYDPSEKFVYYYAHLERYADGLKEGAPLARGQLLGYVGTSGNAPPNTPHLHFAIFRTTNPKRWWEGTPLDPFLVLR
jgi:murein DD-endopeptidase MepM/ murein hydrolase activator NlpD